MEVKVLGYFQDPNHPENIRIVLKTVQSGWEGPPNVVNYFLIPDKVPVKR